MRKTLITAAALTVIAMPAFAQSFDPDVGTGIFSRSSTIRVVQAHTPRRPTTRPAIAARKPFGAHKAVAGRIS